MKRLWTNTLAWLAAVVAAFLLALAGPETGNPLHQHVDLPQGTIPR
jgi:hypothetical protein